MDNFESLSMFSFCLEGCPGQKETTAIPRLGHDMARSGNLSPINYEDDCEDEQEFREEKAAGFSL
eukprot:CCRYP_016810-RA/>CCRYP_016810-RA protein AED:0.41 eAED:0.41 QI:0/-1/0/1/-1/1/1/0/64